MWFLGILWYKCLFLDEIEKSTCEPSLCLPSNPWGKTIWIEMRTLFAGTCKYLEVTFIWLAFYTWLERWRGTPAGIRLVRTMGVLAMQRHHVLRPHLDMLWRFSVKWKRRNLPLCLSKYLILGGVLWEIENRSLLFLSSERAEQWESRSTLANVRPHLRTLYGICQHRFKDPHLGHFVQRERSDKNTDKASSSSLKAP